LSKKLVPPPPPVDDDDGVGALVWVSVKVIKPPSGLVDICCKLVDDVDVDVDVDAIVVIGMVEVEGNRVVLDKVELVDEEAAVVELVEIEEVDVEDVELVEGLRRA
jgi:hypothetical protein